MTEARHNRGLATTIWASTYKKAIADLRSLLRLAPSHDEPHRTQAQQWMDEVREQQQAQRGRGILALAEQRRELLVKQQSLLGNALGLFPLCLASGAVVSCVSRPAQPADSGGFLRRE